MATERWRRRLLLKMAACAVAGRVTAAFSGLRPLALLGAWRRDGRDFVGIWRPDVAARGVELPFRAHEVLLDGTRAQSAIAIGRRPGEFIARIDLASMEIATLRALDPEFTANGHAVLSADGHALLVSESDVLSGVGSIGIYDAESLALLERVSTAGIGPHALLREPQGTLLVANGGVLTLPQSGRAKLNSGSVDASLARLGADGRLLGQWRLRDPNLSIRHLARARNGTVGIALQAEHPDAEARAGAPVFALFDGNSLRCADPASDSLGGYGGDVACVETMAGPLFAVGCTRAGLIAVWDAAGQSRGVYPLRSACAIAVDLDTVFAPSEHGEVGTLNLAASPRWDIGRDAPAWDNHAVVWVD